MLIVNAILLIVTITSVILPTIIDDPGYKVPPTPKPTKPPKLDDSDEEEEDEEEGMFKNKLPHFSALMIVGWIFLFLCVWSLNDKFKSEENDRKLMLADKEAAINYGTADGEQK